jgi:hypothetical protein
MPALDFAVSCSLEPRPGVGRAAMRGTGLRSLPADYHASNYYPQVEDRAEARWGAFTQLWTTRRGAGRVAAFADSTIFSNFSTFEPGKAELMLGMLEWLNHRNALRSAPPLLVGLGMVLAGAALALGRKWSISGLVLLGAAGLGWSAGVVSVRAVHRSAYPLPQPVRPFTQVILDRTVCDVPLSTSGFISGASNGFGIFERWILRLGWFTSRRPGPAAFGGELLVFLYPDREVPPDFRLQLAAYVAAGGRVLVIDSPVNTHSTANVLLHPFGLRLEPAAPAGGVLAGPEGWPAVAVEAAGAVQGGTPLLRLGQTPVAATVRHGRGAVTVLGFGSRFTDAQMGVTGDVIPDAELRQVFELQFRLLRWILSPVPQGASATGPPEVPGQPSE